jgi:hypothetical protein
VDQLAIHRRGLEAGQVAVHGALARVHLVMRTVLGGGFLDYLQGGLSNSVHLECDRGLCHQSAVRRRASVHSDQRFTQHDALEVRLKIASFNPVS